MLAPNLAVGAMHQFHFDFYARASRVGFGWEAITAEEKNVSNGPRATTAIREFLLCPTQLANNPSIAIILFRSNHHRVPVEGIDSDGGQRFLDLGVAEDRERPILTRARILKHSGKPGGPHGPRIFAIS